jgi:hypothetical protein
VIGVKCCVKKGKDMGAAGAENIKRRRGQRDRARRVWRRRRAELQAWTVAVRQPARSGAVRRGSQPRWKGRACACAEEYDRVVGG